MENLTHTLVGLMMARCGLEKTTVRGAGMMMLAANAPDVDAVFWFNRLHYLDYHRSYLHSFAFAPLVALLPMALVRAKFSWKAYGAAIAGVVSHLLLDWTNPYGIQLFLPFSHRRVMLDITNIADVWIWTILFAGLLGPWAMKRFIRPITAKPAPPGTTGDHSGFEPRVESYGDSRRGTSPRVAWAWIALSALLAYEGARFALHAKAIEMLESRTYRGAPPSESIAVPADFVHPAKWKGIACSPGFVTIVPLDVREAYDPSREIMYNDAAQTEAVSVARRLPEFQTMIRFSQAPFWKVTPVEGGTWVELLDLRYGTPDNPGFAEVSRVIPSGSASAQQK